MVPGRNGAIVNQDEHLKILITEGSSGSAKETVYCIGDRYDLGLLDAALFCQCRFSKFVRRVHRCHIPGRYRQEMRPGMCRCATNSATVYSTISRRAMLP